MIVLPLTNMDLPISHAYIPEMKQGSRRTVLPTRVDEREEEQVLDDNVPLTRVTYGLKAVLVLLGSKLMISFVSFYCSNYKHYSPTEQSAAWQWQEPIDVVYCRPSLIEHATRCVTEAAIPVCSKICEN